jgi:hypothetical protein
VISSPIEKEFIEIFSKRRAEDLFVAKEHEKNIYDKNKNNKI